MAPKANSQTQLGPISADESYPLEIFHVRAGIGQWGMRQARKKGLRVVKVGSRKFVFGKDWHDFLQSQTE